MASLGSDVQATSIEIVSIIEEMKERSADLEFELKREQEEKARIIVELGALQRRLSSIDESLGKKTAAKKELDQRLDETCAAFRNILESSKKLLSNAKDDVVGVHTRK
ncbi:sporangia induced deflagellation-inducible protein [Strigomonas culicis]|uniref:Sporangia induced deflagellation-inducible protein n=1 Tax=Strigomonas culicis TaxID=28005 RepID=S9W4L4_9TRYP|nr:sporangia induced deflagellation-inducible protein [Strigomonas culicis]|eukprot:EPY34286.1 sporangia induced deflagellation-inducible protein [Strigomonas culicis]